jgi:hypothetical protein
MRSHIIVGVLVAIVSGWEIWTVHNLTLSNPTH